MDEHVLLAEDTPGVRLIGVFSDCCTIGTCLATIVPVVIGFVSGKKWLFVLAGMLFAIALILKGSKKISEECIKIIFNKTCLANDYTIKEKIIEYEFESRERMILRKTFDIVVEKNGITGVDDKYGWTGKSKVVPQAVQRNTEIRLLDNRYGMQRYMIALKDGRRLCKGEDAHFAMVIPNIDDPKHVSSTHLSSGIYEVTKKITLKVIIPKELKVTNIRCLEYLHYTDDNYYKSHEIFQNEENFKKRNAYSIINEDTNKREITFRVKNPFMGGRYVIDWTFED